MAEPHAPDPVVEETPLVDFVSDVGVQPARISTYTLVPGEQLKKNVAANIDRPLPRLLERIRDAKHQSGPIAIVGAGPTLKTTIERLRKFKGPILACGSVHDYLVRNGIIPTFALVVDGGKEDKGNLSLAQPETIYLIASQCDPSLFEQLAGHKVEMLHYRGQMTPNLSEEAILLHGEPSMGWGGTVTLMAFCIAMMLGYQHLEFFGVDSSYGRYGLDHHCTDIAGSLDYQKLPVNVGDERFISDLGLMVQASQWWRVVEEHAACLDITVHGDGLIAAMARHGESGLDKYVHVAN